MQHERGKKTGRIPHRTILTEQRQSAALPQGVYIQWTTTAGAGFNFSSGIDTCGENPVGKGIGIHDVINQNHETTGAETLLHDRSPCML